MPERDDVQPDAPTEQPKRPWFKSPLVWAAAAVLVLSVVRTAATGPESSSIPLSEALAAIAAGEVAELTIDDASRTAELRYVPDEPADDPDASPGTSGRVETTVFPADFGPDLVAAASDAGVEVTSLPPAKPNLFVSLLFSMLPLVILIGVLLFVLRKSSSGIMGGFSKLPRSQVGTVPTTRFADIAGLTEVVDELREVVGYLHDHGKYQALGGRVPHGFLLVGPPGTGKTLLARAVAGEAGVPFFALSGSDFVETFVGVGAARVRSVFDQARKVGRAIIFIDELDAVGRARGAGGFSSANEESERTLNALLVEMDGFQRNDAVIVLAATNRPEILDQALLRPGRFDRQVLVSLPDRGARAKILALHLADRPVDASVDVESFARRCVGASGADLAFIVNEASLQAAREEASAISRLHLDHAHAVSVLGRERRSASRSDHDRRLTAYHEAGHAVCALVLESVDDPVSVSIIPRGVTGGATWLSPADESYVSRRYALDQLTITMAGRAGEEYLVGDDYTSGATGDLQQATALATKMVSEWGMASGSLSFRPTAAKRVDEAVENLLREALDRARAALDAHRGLYVAVAEELLVDETVDGPRLAELRAAHLAGSPPVTVTAGPPVVATDDAPAAAPAAPPAAV
jgi:cell division protease FtsH